MKPRFLVENLYSDIQFAAHVVSASEEGADGEAWRVATGRRSLRDRWIPVTANLEQWIEVDCAVPRSADLLVLDRGHNLGGHQVLLERSADAFATSTVVLDLAVPSTATAPGDLTAGVVRSEEGAVLCRFPAVASRYWRLRIPAMGAGLRPEVVGLWLGTSWQPSQYFDLPHGPGTRELAFSSTGSDAGWIGRGSISRARAGEIGLKLSSTAEAETARYHLEGGFWRPRPMWIIHNESLAERAVLAMPQPGRVGLSREQGWGWDQTQLSWIEHEPLVGA